MTQLKSPLMMALVLLFSGLMTTAPVNAQQASDAEIKQMIQEQFERMYQKGVKDLKERIVVTGGVKPFAVVTDTADKSKTIRIKQIEEMPASVALEVLRRSLVALVKKGKIGATAVFYTTANPNEESDAEQVLVVEMEHIFGPTLAQLVPYTVMEGQARFGEQVVVDMESRIFNLKASDEVSE
ncbi:hypothetical protein KUV59_04750 [Marinobacter daepoensis]|uniref:hypothetical protein n=1 Tax=Marinobacter daepoensis TaxID=262077 RepID=UPI001C979886|nr:hypothetical protein [Marinobacter daepoensis]MBY6032466.1 hypothetical protein [Marinobacter daepoensis]